MKKLALALAVGAAAILGASGVNAAPVQKQTQSPAASHSDSASQAIDMSSRHRHWRHRHWGHRHWHHRHHRWGYYRPYHRPYYRSYGYYPGYYRPAPVVSFGFGFGGGPRWGHHHWRRW